MSQDQWLIVGLGNPDPKYHGNRHNVGQMVIDELADRMGVKLTAHKARALVAQGKLGTPGVGGVTIPPSVILAKLACYMNVSGGPTRALCDFFKIDPDHLLVIHDELDLPEYTLRLKQGGGEGGHNGLRSISQHLGTKNYCRLRVGIGRPPGQMDTAAFVLSDFPAKQREDWLVTIREAADAVEEVTAKGFQTAQMELHSRS